MTDERPGSGAVPVTCDGVRDGGSVTRLSDAERARRYRERVKAAKASEAGQGRAERDAQGHWLPGNQASQTAALVTGWRSPRLVDELAREVIADLLAKPSCPQRLREDPDDEDLLAWGAAVAVCRLLRASITTANIEAAMTETVAEEETSTHPSTLAAGSRSLQGKRRPAVLDTLHKFQSQQIHLSKVLGLDAASRRMAGEDKPAQLDLARYWEQRAERQAAEESAG